MQASEHIRESLARVSAMRQLAAAEPGLAQAVVAVKQLQAQRFVATYPDLLADPVYAPSATFFLEELYSARDYTERDAQFARLAGALERTFPAPLVATAVALAQLHCQTETLDLAMAQCWWQNTAAATAMRYVTCWRTVGQRNQRNHQLASVLEIGRTLGQLTRKAGLRLMLKMMRAPAHLAGLGSLQHFLESGFDHFASMARRPGAIDVFLGVIGAREARWIDDLFDAPAVTCETHWVQALGLAPSQKR